MLAYCQIVSNQVASVQTQHALQAMYQQICLHPILQMKFAPLNNTRSTNFYELKNVTNW